MANAPDAPNPAATPPDLRISWRAVRRGGCLVTLAALAAGAIALWNTDDFWRGWPERTIHVGDVPVMRAFFAPDDRTLATISFDGQVHVFNPLTGTLARTWKAHECPAYGLAYSPDGATLATGGDETVALWDAATGQLRHRLNSDTGQVYRVAFSADGRSVVSNGIRHREGTKPVYEEKCWDVATGAPAAGAVANVTDVESAANGTVARPAGLNVRLESADGQLLRTIAAHPDQLNAVAFSPDGRLLATAGGYTIYACAHPIPWKNGDVRVWDGRAGGAVSPPLAAGRGRRVFARRPHARLGELRRHGQALESPRPLRPLNGVLGGPRSCRRAS